MLLRERLCCALLQSCADYCNMKGRAMMVQESQGTARCSNADALREVLARYDSSGRGVLSWTDVCTAYAGIYGVDVGSRPPLWKALATGPLKQTAAPAKDPNDALRACTVSIDDLVAHLIGGATKDEMELAQVMRMPRMLWAVFLTMHTCSCATAWVATATLRRRRRLVDVMCCRMQSAPRSASHSIRSFKTR